MYDPGESVFIRLSVTHETCVCYFLTSFASVRVTTMFVRVYELPLSFPPPVFVSIILKMPLSLYSRIHRPGENLLPTHSHIPLP